MKIETPCWASDWSVDEVAECLPGMLSSGVYEVLWGYVDDDRRVTLEEIWGKLTPQQQQAIVSGYNKEHGVDND